MNEAEKVADCPACAAQPGGSVNSRCIDCRKRMVASGPWFFASIVKNKYSPRYISQLQDIFGAGCDIDAADAEIKSVAKQHQRGSLSA